MLIEHNLPVACAREQMKEVKNEKKTTISKGRRKQKEMCLVCNGHDRAAAVATALNWK